MSWTHPKTGAPLKRVKRGFKKFVFTYETLAEALDMKPKSVRAAVSRGDFDPTDLVSLAKWIVSKSRRQDPQPSQPEMQEEKTKVETDCACDPRPVGMYSPANRAFYCPTCGLITRKL